MKSIPLRWNPNFSPIRFGKKNLTGKLCLAPYIVLEIGIDGNVGLCDCAAWLPTRVGNIYKQPLSEILAGAVAVDIRKSINNGTYEFCNERTCGVMQQDQFIDRDSVTEPGLLDLLSDSNKFIMPREIWIAGDQTCNLSCPSCRTQVIKHSEQEIDYLEELGQILHKNLFEKPRDDDITLHTSTSREPFASPLILSFINTIDIDKFPNLKLSIQTNGLLAKQFWHKLGSMQHRVSNITVTVDAATKESYEILRRGGTWENIQHALQWLADKKIQNGMKLIHRMIVQQQNFQEVVDFYDQAMHFGADEVQYARIMHWHGTVSDQEFATMDVFGNHPEREHAQQVLDQLQNRANVFLSGGLQFTN